MQYKQNNTIIIFRMKNNLKITTAVIALFVVPIMTFGIMSNVGAQQNATGIADTTNNSGVPDAAVGGSSGTNSSIGGNTSNASDTISGNNGGEDNQDKFQ